MLASLSSLAPSEKAENMKSLILLGLAFIASAIAFDNHEHNKVVCFWNSSSIERELPGKFKFEYLQPALTYCTHLVYGYAGINVDTKELVSLNPHLDTGAGLGFYRRVTQLKQSYPNLKIYLSVGGDGGDPYEETHKYLTLTETPEARNTFVNSVVRVLSEYGFDGIDLAWQFPPMKVPTHRGRLSTIWQGIKRVFGYGKFHDKKETEHRDGFTSLVRELRNPLMARDKDVTITVLPHVNASVYYDARLLSPNIDAVHLMTFDQKTPERNPKEADYPAPIYESNGRADQDNVDYPVRYWLENGTPGGKIVVGIPTFGRTWKLTSDSKITGEPPIVTDGPGSPGPQTQTPGILSFPEICTRLMESIVGRVRRIGDSTNKFGTYAYKSYDPETKIDGIWIGYEDTNSASAKAYYVKSKSLGGVAIFDLSNDDYHGICTNNNKYPIVRAAKYNL